MSGRVSLLRRHDTRTRGGPKGYALTLTIGLLSTMLSGAFFGSEVTNMYDDLENPQNIGHLFGVLPIATFEDMGIYFDRIAKAGTEVRGVKRSPGVERIHLPGGREALLAARRRIEGIPVGMETWRSLTELAEPAGLKAPVV
jgi:LDH2 family malate/lactate/ureidoglycolate dehydrogenase